MICEECESCPIHELCDMVDKIIDDNMSLDGEHDVLMAIYEKGRADAIDEFVEFANTMPTVETEDGEIRPLWLEEMAEILKEQNK